MGLIEATLNYGRGGYYVEWFQDDGERGLRAYWYGSRAECEQRMKEPAPELTSMAGVDGPPHDAATATGMYD